MPRSQTTTEMDTTMEFSSFNTQSPVTGLDDQSHAMDDPLVKSESEDDNDSAQHMLRKFRGDEQARDSPNSSMTSASLLSGGAETKTADRTQPTRPPKPSLSLQSSPPQPKTMAKFRARVSIPTRLSPSEYGCQCVAAARASRLDPYKLHLGEHQFLEDQLCHLHVTVYLNIRNGILRLWVRNPNVSVCLEEAIGCAKDERWTQLACFAYEWLYRSGYINHGCVEGPFKTKGSKGRRAEGASKTIVVIGGGMAGLGCARQLTSFSEYFLDRPLRIVVLEGRERIGGRIYSHPLTSMRSETLSPHQRPTAEMGAHIIVGFENGNPLDAIIRGQLALGYHSLRDLSTLYDIDGIAVAESQDTMIEKLYNDILDRSGQYREKTIHPATAKGEKELIDSSRDPTDDDGLTINQYEKASASEREDLLLPAKSKRRGAGHKAPKHDQPSEQVEVDMGTQTQLPAATVAKEIGFRLKPHVKIEDSLDLSGEASVPNPSLGHVLYQGVEQYSEFLELKPKALRLLNWHFANLEYANATNVQHLSLTGWDQDSGNEFEGEHAQIIGGYQQVPRALWRYPEKLDVRTNKVVSNITYDEQDSDGKAEITCEDGEVIQADRVVLTAPLGVLKEQSIHFNPPLPDYKQKAISNLGFGLLNKVVLVFEKPFWDVDRDMFGLLRSQYYGDGNKQEHYELNRGDFYLFWNCIKTSGLPVLIALMAGDAAEDSEPRPDRRLVQNCVGLLRKVFGRAEVPEPRESIVTRWKSDRFARGTYSFVGREAKPGDYDDLAKGIGNLHFAGEATCRSHPATVHGAYLSGLRAASEVLESLIGPINLPTPLVAGTTARPKPTLPESKPHTPTILNPPLAPKRKGDPVLPAGTFTRPVKDAATDLNQEWDAAMWDNIYATIGFAPPQPSKTGTNPFLLFQKDHWATCRATCDARKASGRGKTDKPSARDEVRIELGKMWKVLDDEGREPYVARTRVAKEVNDEKERVWKIEALEWERRTWEVKDEWIEAGNGFDEWVEKRNRAARGGAVGSKRFRTHITC